MIEIIEGEKVFIPLKLVVNTITDLEELHSAVSLYVEQYIVVGKRHQMRDLKDKLKKLQDGYPKLRHV